MIIVKTTPCPSCQNSIRVSVKQLPKHMYEIFFFDGRDKNTRTRITQCPHCKTDLFQSSIIKTLTGLEPSQLNR